MREVEQGNERNHNTCRYGIKNESNQSNFDGLSETIRELTLTYLGVVLLALTASALDLVDLTNLAGSMDVLEVHLERDMFKFL